MGARRRARECALQMLFAADVTGNFDDTAVDEFWSNLAENENDAAARDFADRLAKGTMGRLDDVDKTIKTRAEHWRIERMAIVDRNILRLAVNEFLFEDTPHTVIINEALEIARCYSSFEATQFINGILDAIKKDLRQSDSTDEEVELADEEPEKKSDPERTRATSS